MILRPICAVELGPVVLELGIPVERDTNSVFLPFYEQEKDSLLIVTYTVLKHEHIFLFVVETIRF